jgi:hypothetical protein
MMKILFCLIASLRSIFSDRGELALENLAPRQQLAILARTHSHPQLRKMDRLFWVWLSRMWKSWREPLIIVKPDTVVRWALTKMIEDISTQNLAFGSTIPLMVSVKNSSCEVTTWQTLKAAMDRERNSKQSAGQMCPADYRIP